MSRAQPSIRSGVDLCWSRTLSEEFERIPRCQTKCLPRFFFISDDELLSILGSSEPSAIQEHMIKMFDNVASLRLVKVSDTVTQAQGMISAENEEMPFKQSIVTEGQFEDWMTKVLEEMRRTNKMITKEAVYYYRFRKSRIGWMYNYQGMVVLAANQIWFVE